MFFKKCLELYPTWAGIAALALLIIHFIMPYHPREKYPRDDPPPKFFASFSLGELIQYVIQVLTFPIVLFASAFVVVELGFSNEAGAVAFFILAIIWWFIPRNLARKIDGW